MSAARGGSLAGAVGGRVLPRACLHCGPGRDHEAGKLTRCAGLCLCPQERKVRERLPEPPTCSSVHSLQRQLGSGHLYGAGTG